MARAPGWRVRAAGIFLGLLQCAAHAPVSSAVHLAAVKQNPATLRKKPCRVAHRTKVVDVGGFLGWSLGLYGVWRQPAVYVGDRLRFTWPAPAGGDSDRLPGKPGNRGRGSSTKLLEHNVYCMTSKRAFDRCQFSERCSLSERNYTSPRIRRPGTYYYSCEEDNHCRDGQKVAIVVRPAPKYDPCPPRSPPPAPKGVHYVGNHPGYWTLDLSGWKQPKVVTGDKLVFLWNKNTAAPPHNVFRMPSKSAYDSCDFSQAKKLTGTTNTGSYTYQVKERAGTTLYFGCEYTFHCIASMKVAIKVS